MPWFLGVTLIANWQPFCYECVAEWKSEESWIFDMISALSCLNFVEGVFLDYQ